MNAWSNIEASPKDSEIIEIDKLEKTLGDIPTRAKQVRELITRFEVCHFKYREHLQKINDSILNLKPVIDAGKIGANHVGKGEDAWRNDKTGRSLLGQQCLWALRNWLDYNSQLEALENYDKELARQISMWLGDKNPDKERLVRLLIARLTWDWKSYEEFQHGGKYKELNDQVCRMDICHFNFPENLNALLIGIGEMKPVKNFDGCSTFNDVIKEYLEEQFSTLCNYLKSKSSTGNDISLAKTELIKLWLITCLAKTIKEQVGLTTSLPKLII